MPNNNPYQSSTLVKAQATYYPNMVSVFIPHTPFLREPTTDPKSRNYDPKELEDQLPTYSNETDPERALRRARKKINDYVLCNRFELFATFTFGGDNRQDINEKRKQMSDWLRNQRHRNGKFNYLIVPELHKDSALHFHALLNSYCGTIKKAVNPNTGKLIVKKGKQQYNLPEYTLGFTNAQLTPTTPKDRSKVAGYIRKYISKDMPTFFNRQRYWVSSGLKLPIIEDNPEEWYKVIKPDWQMENDYGTILRFDIGDHPLVDIYWGARQ